MNVDAERTLLQPIGAGRRLRDDGEDGVSAFGRCERVIDAVTLDPLDAEAVVGGADDTGDVNRDLGLADLGERIVRAGVVASISKRKVCSASARNAARALKVVVSRRPTKTVSTPASDGGS